MLLEQGDLESTMALRRLVAIALDVVRHAGGMERDAPEQARRAQTAVRWQVITTPTFAAIAGARRRDESTQVLADATTQLTLREIEEGHYDADRRAEHLSHERSDERDRSRMKTARPLRPDLSRGHREVDGPDAGLVDLDVAHVELGRDGRTGGQEQ